VIWPRLLANLISVIAPIPFTFPDPKSRSLGPWASPRHKQEICIHGFLASYSLLILWSKSDSYLISILLTHFWTKCPTTRFYWFIIKVWERLKNMFVSSQKQWRQCYPFYRSVNINNWWSCDTSLQRRIRVAVLHKSTKLSTNRQKFLLCWAK
jgi:hypothetical protein